MTSGNGKGTVAVEQRKPRRLLGWPEDFERYFDQRLGEWPFRFWRRPAEAEAWMPDVDVFEKNGKVVIRTDLPGMRPEDIDVSVEGDLLTIKGHREEEKEVKEEDYYCSERATGDFLRTVRLPEGAAPDKVDAHYENGVLEVTIPKPVAKGEAAVKVPVK
jgi:HSP20 family protein